MRKLLLITILVLLVLLLTATVHAQATFPQWEELVHRVWAKNNPAVMGPYDGTGFMWDVSRRASMRIDSAYRLYEALRDIRAANPAAFDAVFSQYGLALDTR